MLARMTISQRSRRVLRPFAALACRAPVARLLLPSATVYLSRFAVLLALASMFAVSGCGWVDSTGRQADDAEPGTMASFDNDVSVSPGEGIALLEETMRSIRLSDPGDGTWTWHPVAIENPATCSRFNGFDPIYAADSLEDACADSNECRVEVLPNAGDDGRVTLLRMPKLAAPIALRYRAESTDSAGILHKRTQVLCGISVNEAPLANDDAATARLGERLVVSGTSVNSLLTNDSDDLDRRNQPLRVLETAYREPAYAAEFTLGSDGSYTYLADEASAGTAREDSFVYVVSDGLHEVRATVRITLRESNVTPVIIHRLEDIELDVGEAVAQDLSGHFADPDGDPLAFSATPGSLPPSGNIALSREGVLIGTPEDEDIGPWRVVVNAGDGNASIADSFIMTIVERPNRAPMASDIDNRRVSGSFAFDVSTYFSDPDGDELLFTSTSLPHNVTLSDDGTISGRVSFYNLGHSYIITVTATDPDGLSVSDAFRLTIGL
ncbi:MAG: hypothetical protein CSB44_11085 [Gammaproteobacteria bacterium]|nr:MAG: hypothetical protein CSB44_11085 [Gammaproteobacteria bacterium]